MSNEEQRLSILSFIESEINILRSAGHLQAFAHTESVLRRRMRMLAEFILHKYKINPGHFSVVDTEPNSIPLDAKPKGLQEALYTVTTELRALRETINAAAEQIAPEPKYVQLNPQGRVIDGTPVLPAPRPVIIHRGETYYFAGEYARNYPGDGEIYATYAYKLKKKGG